MDRSFGEGHYTTVSAENASEGWGGLELYRSMRGKAALVAKIIYWDASGQFSFETVGTDIPVEIVEDLIAEARRTIQVR